MLATKLPIIALAGCRINMDRRMEIPDDVSQAAT